MRTRTVLLVASVALLVPAAARAVDLPNSFTARPRGAGTEQPTRRKGGPEHMREGIEAEVNAGGGFTDTYGFGVGGRVGYTFRPGFYVGGNTTYYFGRTVTTPTASESSHAFFVAAEAAYKFYPGDQTRWEIRPFVLAGPSFTKTVTEVPLRTVTATTFAVAPGLLTAYHFGDVFVSAEGRVNVTSPSAFSLLAGAGLAF